MNNNLNYVSATLTSVLADMANLLNQPDMLAEIAELGDSIASVHNDGGRIYFTGIGKPSFVAMKLAATCKSLQIDAEYLDATSAGHGDIGGIPGGHNKSLLIALSKSGLSGELYELFDKIADLRPTRIKLLCFPTEVQLQRINENLQPANYDIQVVPITLALSEIDGYGIVPTASNAFFELICGTAIGVAAEAWTPALLTKLKGAHPSGTLYDKVCKQLEKIKSESITRAVADTGGSNCDIPIAVAHDTNTSEKYKAIESWHDLTDTDRMSYNDFVQKHWKCADSMSGEVLAYDKAGNLLPFSEVMTQFILNRTATA
jgi:hypothetical protein